MTESRRLFDFKPFGERPAFISDLGETVSFARLDALSEELSRLCGTVSSETGTKPLIMMLTKNTLAAFCLYIAMLQGGCPMMLVSASLPGDMCRQILNTYKPALLLIPDALRSSYAPMRELLALGDYRMLRTNFAQNYPVHPELAVMVTTSGSTGSVKFVRQSWNNIRANTEAVADYLEIGENDRMITSMSLIYTYTQSKTRATLFRGGSVVVTAHDVMEGEFWDLMENHRITMLHGVSNIYEIMRRLDLFSEDFPDLRTLTQGGGKLNRELHAYIARYAHETGKRFYTTYGLSETTASITYLLPERSLEKPGSVGRPYPDGSYRLLDADGTEIHAPHTPGEIVYRGSNVALGYAQCGEDLAKGDEWNGVLHTGDIAEMDEDGDLYIVGRKKRFIKVHGYRISLDEIDGRIMDDLNILTVSVGPDDHPVIWITNPDDEAQIKAYIREKIPVLRTVAKCAVIDEIPRTEAGKIRYGLLQEKALELG